ncbi:MAG: hypothetical protein IJO06_08145 [Thermoguttaceae bacterium]|nr:hypothetical protein [Thermoguttaceae bacterium]
MTEQQNIYFSIDDAFKKMFKNILPWLSLFFSLTALIAQISEEQPACATVICCIVLLFVSMIFVAGHFVASLYRPNDKAITMLLATYESTSKDLIFYWSAHKFHVAPSDRLPIKGKKEVLQEPVFQCADSFGARDLVNIFYQDLFCTGFFEKEYNTAVSVNNVEKAEVIGVFGLTRKGFDYAKKISLKRASGNRNS